MVQTAHGLKSAPPGAEDSLRYEATGEGDSFEQLRFDESDEWARLGDPELRNTIRRVCMQAGWTRPQEGVSRTMAVAGVVEGEGGSFIAQAIAISTALDLGSSVLLIDCNFTAPTLQEDFGLADGPGLSEVLSSASDIGSAAAAAIRPSGLHSLSLLPAGELIDNPSRLTRSARMTALLQYLSHEYAFTVLDLPSVVQHSEAAVLARQTDGAVLVVQAGRTDQRALQQAAGMLSGAIIHGVVLNRQRSKVPRLVRRLLAL